MTRTPETGRNLERVKGLSESNITTMDNALSEIESIFKKIEQMFGLIK